MFNVNFYLIKGLKEKKGLRRTAKMLVFIFRDPSPTLRITTLKNLAFYRIVNSYEILQNFEIEGNDILGLKVKELNCL